MSAVMSLASRQADWSVPSRGVAASARGAVRENRLWRPTTVGPAPSARAVSETGVVADDQAGRAEHVQPVHRVRAFE